MMKRLFILYHSISEKLNLLQSPFLLAIRVYWGVQLAQTGWGKMHNIPGITKMFTGLQIPLPAFNAHFVSGLEFFGGLLLIIGLASRLTGFLVFLNMCVAYWTADRESLAAIFAFSDDPGKFYQAAPFAFLFAALIVLIFGAGLFSLDALISKRFKEV